MRFLSRKMPVFLSLFFLIWIFDIRAESAQKASNKAVTVKILKSSTTDVLFGETAKKGRIFIVLETEWENIHPKQKVEEDKLEGKTDRTMGVGALAGRKKKTETEYIDADVAYMVEKLYDHAYCIADGLAYSLHQLTGAAPQGIALREPFMIAKQGEKRKAALVYAIPEKAENLCFQFLDYEYGHILLPVKGRMEEAKRSGLPPGNVLDRIESPLVTIAAHSFHCQKSYDGEEAPEGWEYAVVHLSGKSLSGQTVKDIVQIEPTEYTWALMDGGYLYYAVGGSITEEGMIRFAPEIFQYQHIAFLVPESGQIRQLGIRLRNNVFLLDLTDEDPTELPEPRARHRDSDVMEVMLFDVKEENSFVIVDLGIQSLAASGIEIQRKAQFQLVVDDKKIVLDNSATDRLYHRPPEPFIVPPKTFVRFELAYESEDPPSSLYFRGYRSEATLNFHAVESPSRRGEIE